MLRVDGLSCGYGGELVVRDVSFSVRAGERLCILGPNGCGKTTLLRAVAGLLPHVGTVTICGQDAARLSRRALARKLALMSQLSPVSFSYTVYETVAMGRYAHGRGGLLERESPEDRQLIRTSLERTGMWEMRDRLVTELSGGQLQRVFLARAFAQDPAVILLDEPTNHLDLKYQAELTEELRSWAEQGERCVAGVFHDVNLALRFGHRVLVMEDGRILADCPVDDLDRELLNRVYGLDVAGYMRENLKRWERA